jgi:hypothetical protein
LLPNVLLLKFVKRAEKQSAAERFTLLSAALAGFSSVKPECFYT